MKKLIPLFLVLFFVSCKEPPQYLHNTTFEVRFSDGQIDTVTCDYVNDYKDKRSFLMKEGCLQCGQFYYFMETVACNVSTYRMISDSSSIYTRK